MVALDVDIVEEARRIRSSAVEQRILARARVLDARATMERSRMSREAAELARTETARAHASAPADAMAPAR